MTIHPNSIAANKTVNHSKRQEAVLAVLRANGKPMTDREVCIALGSQDMNYARPAITRLVQDGDLEEIGDIACPVTGRHVRLVWITKQENAA